jgi:Fic family protein
MSQKHTDIIMFVMNNKDCSSTEISAAFEKKHSLATIKRILQQLIIDEAIIKTGSAKNTRYRVSDSYPILHEVNVEEYYKNDIDERKINNIFNFNLIKNVLPDILIFNKEELKSLEEHQIRFSDNIQQLNKFEYENEMERLAIDLSWKSSQIEGNTYSLLETEQLLKEQKTAAGKSRDEATMLLNHKEAIDFIVGDPDYMYPLTLRNLEDLHSILIKGLAEKNIRTKRVAITGTNYLPLDNEFQIKEALQDMCDVVNNKTNIFEKAIIVLLLISYIQPFIDGNKRTARIVCNAILLHFKYCPLSFRTVDTIDYKKAILLFYEINNLSAFKKIFIDQYAFAVNTYF